MRKIKFKSGFTAVVLVILMFSLFLKSALQLEMHSVNDAGGTCETSVKSIAELELLWISYHNGTVQSVAWSSDSKYVLSGAEDLTAKIWYAQNGSFVRNLTHGTYIYSVAWQKNSSFVVTTGNFTAKIWNASTGALLHTLTHSPTKNVWCSAFSTNNTLATGGGDGTIKIWDVSSGALIRTLTTGSSVRAVCFSPNNTYIAAGLWNNNVQIWDAEKGTLVETLVGHGGAVYTVDWSSDGGRIVSGSGADYTVRIWNFSTRTNYTFATLSSTVKSVQFSADGFVLLTAESNRAIKIWNLTTAAIIKTLTHGTTGSLYSARFSPDYQKIVSCSSVDFSVRCYADQTVPSVVSITTTPSSPLNATIATIYIKFSEQMARTTLNVTYGLQPPYDEYSVVGDWIATDLWHGRFEILSTTPNGVYTFNISGGLDLAGNLMEAFTSFQIEVDTVKPCIVSVMPTGTAPKNTVIEVVFSEPMNRSSVENAFSISPSVNGLFKFDAAKLTFIPIHELTPNTNYTVTLSDFARDLAGNRLDEYSWQFTAVEDTEPPEVIEHYPTGTAVPVDTIIKITFSELMNKTTVEDAFSVLPQLSGSFAWDLNALIYTPASKLQENTIYTVTIDSSAKDLAGNNLVAPYSWWFKTVASPMPNFDEFEELVGIGHTAAVRSVAWHPDGKRIISGSEDGTVKIWNVERANLTLTKTVSADVKIYSVAYSPDGLQYASGGAGTAKIWSSATDNCLAPLDHGGEIVYAVKYSPNGRLVATAGNNQYIKFWSTDKFEQVGIPINCKSTVLALAFVGNDKIAAGLSNNTVTIWNITSGSLEKFLTHGGDVYSVDWAELGNRLISGSGGDRTVKIWNLTEDTHYKLMTFKEVVRAVRWHQTAKAVAIGTSADRKIWLMDTGANVYKILKHGKAGSLYTVEWSEDGKKLASGSSGDNSVRLWCDLTKPSVTRVYFQPASPVNVTNLTVNIEFSETMDVSCEPNVTFGLTEPFENYKFSGGWVAPTKWEGYYLIPQNIENGLHTLKIEGAFDFSGNEIATYTDAKFEIDTIQPAVTDYEPVGLKVRCTSNIKISFSEMMNKTSVESGFSISPFVEGILTWLNTSCIYSVDRLGWETTYTVTLSGAKDSAGNPLPAFEWSFTTRSATDLDSIMVEPHTITVCVGGKVQFKATAYNGLGEEMIVTFEWAVTPNVAEISNTGLFEALSVGFCTVYANATYAGVSESGSASVNIVESQLAYVAIQPFPTVKVLCNSTIKFHAQAYDVAGQIISSGVSYEWSIYPAELGTIDSEGLFKASSSPVSGFVRVNATYKGRMQINGTEVEVVKVLNPGWLVGRVTVFETGAKLADVKVSVNSSDFTYTNATGDYNLTLPKGVYTVYAAKAGYFEYQKNGVVVSSNQTTILNITMKLAGIIKVIVLDDTKPLEGARINVYEGGTHKIVKSVLTNSTGRFEFQPLPLGKYDVEVLKNGYETFKASVELTVSQPIKELTVRLKQVAFPIGLLVSVIAVCGVVCGIAVYTLYKKKRK